MTAAESEVPMPMKKAYGRLERWRSRRTGRSHIPDSVWRAAGELARERGVSRVAEVLGLEFNHLNRMSRAAESAAELARQRGRRTRCHCRGCCCWALSLPLSIIQLPSFTHRL